MPKGPHGPGAAVNDECHAPLEPHLTDAEFALYSAVWNSTDMARIDRHLQSRKILCGTNVLHAE